MKYEDWIIRYGAITRKRFNKNEKLKFLTGISQEFHEMGYSVDVKEAKIAKDVNYNLYVGDINNAKNVIAAYYDTPPSTYGILPYKLFDENNRKLSYLISIFFPMTILIIIGAIFILNLATPMWSNSKFELLDIIYTIVVIFIFAVMYKIRSGVGSQTNFIRNTSSIIALLAFADSLSPYQRKNTAFVLTDNGCKNCIGDMLVTEGINKKTTIIHLECIGDTSPIYLFYPKRFSKELSYIKDSKKLEDIKIFDLSELNKKLTLYQKNDIYITAATKRGDSFLISKGKTIKKYLDINNLEKAVECMKILICIK